MVAVADELQSRVEAELAKLQPLFDDELPAIDAAARALALPLVRTPR